MKSIKVAPIRLWLLALCIMTLWLAACSPATAVEEARIPPVSVYFTTAENDPLVAEFAATGAAVLTSPPEVEETFAGNPDLTALYIGEGSLSQLDSDWLHELYLTGVWVVAINEPLSALNAAAKPFGGKNMADLDLSLTPEGFVVVTAAIAGDPRGHNYYVLSEYFPNVAGAIEVMGHYDASN